MNKEKTTQVSSTHAKGDKVLKGTFYSWKKHLKNTK